MNWIQMNILAEMGFYVSENGRYAAKGPYTQVWYEGDYLTQPRDGYYSVFHNGKRFVFNTFEDVTRFFNGDK